MRRSEPQLDASHPGTLPRCANERCTAPVSTPGERCRWCAAFDADLVAQLGYV